MDRPRVRNKKRYKHQHGFTYLEFIFVIFIISTLIFISLDRLWAIRAAAERASVTQVIGNIKSALGLEVVRLALQGKMADIALLENANPIPLLAQPPTTYLGEKTETSETGVWYFDKKKNALIYNVIFDENFKTTLNGLPRIRHQVRLIYNDNNHNKRFDIEHDNIYGLDLLPLEKFSWKKANIN